jgi:hypothetical protein
VKRAIVLLTAAAVVAVPVVADAAVRKPRPTKRVVTWSYTAIHGVTTPAASTAFESPCTINADACFDLQTLKHETKVKVDAAGKVAIQYFLDGDYDGVQTLCGTGTIPVKKGTLVTLVTVLDPTCAGVPTTGQVALTVTGLK